MLAQGGLPVSAGYGVGLEAALNQEAGAGALEGGSGPFLAGLWVDEVAGLGGAKAGFGLGGACCGPGLVSLAWLLPGCVAAGL